MNDFIVIFIAIGIYIIVNLIINSNLIKDNLKIFVRMGIAVICVGYLYTDYFLKENINICLLILFTIVIIFQFVIYFYRNKKKDKSF